MQSENFDNRFREAADHHHPNYDETAWAKMESLLDEHMPVEKKKKRRFLFFFLLFIFAGGTTWILVDKPWEDHTNITKATTTSPSSTAASAENSSDFSEPANESENLKQQSSASSSPTEVQIQSPNHSNEQENDDPKTLPGNISKNALEEKSNFNVSTSKGTIGFRKKISSDHEDDTDGLKTDEKIIFDAKGAGISKNLKSGTEKESTNINEGESKTPEARSAELSGNESEVSQQNEKMAEDEKDPEGQKKTDEPVKEETEKKDDNAKQASQKKNRTSNFFLHFGAAPDISMVKMKGAGPTRIAFGLGLGYTFKERLTIRTGLYSAKKLYSAQPSDYKPGVPLPNPDYLVRIDADCDVYEIPVLLTYNLKSGRNYNFFAGGGLSSYLMKKESYDYVYKYPGDDTEHKYNWSMKDKNKHLFSVATLSAGYERKIGKRVTLIGEPYVKFPLSGIGAGKVSLNSAGVLVSITYSPFGR